ncbi:MAG TPA: hypothetical protein VFZ65_02030 [Planctomycetota bacterium]|nr:hypothetical protein [Planctomycetota bacterium]
MNRITLMFLATLLGAAVSSPAQVRAGSRSPRGPVSATVPQRVDQPVRHASGRRAGQHQQGHWETRCEQVLVPGYWSEEHVPATYGWIYSLCGHREWGIVDRGGCRRVWVPDRWETRSHRVWVAGC